MKDKLLRTALLVQVVLVLAASSLLTLNLKVPTIPNSTVARISVEPKLSKKHSSKVTAQPAYSLNIQSTPITPVYIPPPKPVAKATPTKTIPAKEAMDDNCMSIEVRTNSQTGKTEWRYVSDIAWRLLEPTQEVDTCE